MERGGPDLYDGASHRSVPRRVRFDAVELPNRTKSFLVIDVGERVYVEAEGLVAVPSDGKDPVFLLGHETPVKGWVQFKNFVDAFALVFAEVDDDESFVDN